MAIERGVATTRSVNDAALGNAVTHDRPLRCWSELRLRAVVKKNSRHEPAKTENKLPARNVKTS
jgi:hypothetical protein